MLFFDVNVVLNAAVERLPLHDEMRPWLLNLVNGRRSFGVNESVLSSFIRIATNPRFPGGAVPIVEAATFATLVRDSPRAVRVVAGPGHWPIFQSLCVDLRLRGNLVADAYLAAVALEQDLEFVTTDSDFARFPGLRWRHPLSP